MNKFVKYLIIFIIVDILVIGAFLLFRSSPSPTKPKDSEYEWTTMDEYYVPRNYVEQFIYEDAEAKGLLPVSIRNFRKDARMLRKFRGKNFAGPKEAQLKMMFNGLEDWMLIELKYKDEKDREIQRATLYVLIKEEWRVGDTGTMAQ